VNELAKVMAIASGKGGTGKTTVAVNIGLALSMLGKSMMIVDANMDSPHIGFHLGIPISRITLNDVLQGQDIVNAAFLHPSGMKFITGNMSLELSNYDPIALSRVLSSLSSLNSDVIIDTGAGFEKSVLAALSSSEETLVVTTPDRLSVLNAKKTISLAEKNYSTVIGVVVNKFQKNSMSIESIEKFLQKKVIGVIPNDNKIKAALQLQEPLLDIYPNSKAALAFQKLAANIVGEKYVNTISKQKKVFQAL